MRKVFLFMMVTIDGYFEGPEHSIDWHNVDDEFSKFAIEQLDEADTLVFGRRTYDLMYNFWPSAAALKSEPKTAERMNSYRKIVFSRTLRTADWNNTELHHEEPGGIIRALKKQPGKDIAVLGSSSLAVSLLETGVLDEVRIMVNPVALGSGSTLFVGLHKPVHFSLESARKFKSGNELLIYSITPRKLLLG